MPLRFTVLASGSSGNASLVEGDGFGVLLDAGLGPRQLAARFGSAGLSWARVQAVVLTHTHGDHWRERTLANLVQRRIPLYCHPEHRDGLGDYSPAFADLCQAGLVRTFAAGEEIAFAPGLRCRPLPIRHDGGATFGFRFTGAPDLFGHAASLAYAADLGSWDDALADALADVELLAVEFNHDEEMERTSGRSPYLIARVLGDEGHLSNAQAAALLRTVLARTPNGRLRHVVQLHLSRECNHPKLARAAAQEVLADNSDVALHTAHQDRVGRMLVLGAGSERGRRVAVVRRPVARRGIAQQLLPGFGHLDASRESERAPSRSG
jgi:phosphoribosyl 1,2-cyclic phosphodiesterase